MSGVSNIAAEVLAVGQLPLVKGVIYLAKSDAFVRTIKLVNVNAPTTINLYVNKTGIGTSRRIIPRDMDFGARFMTQTDWPFSLQLGDTLEGDSTVPGVDFTVLGELVP